MAQALSPSVRAIHIEREADTRVHGVLRSELDKERVGS